MFILTILTNALRIRVSFHAHVLSRLILSLDLFIENRKHGVVGFLRLGALSESSLCAPCLECAIGWFAPQLVCSGRGC